MKRTSFRTVAEPETSLLRDPLTFRNPYPAYATLRPHSPLQVSRSSWILLSYEHVRAALADPERFSSNVRGSDNPVFRDSPLIFDDPPRHTQIRRIMTKAFTPKRVAEAEPWIREIADRLLDDIGTRCRRLPTRLLRPACRSSSSPA